ncbi:MAG: efflux RND transporter permease subunit [Kiritimatiellae bacterium]|nr:efflux RND transporter permease subunit [Kiritimatiellia bacterium]
MNDQEKDRGPIAWMASNPVAANLLMLILLIGGLMILPQIRQEVFPEFELDIVNISVAYPGAAPTEIEQGILLAVEEAIRGLDGMKRVTSRAAEGYGTVTAELLLGTDRGRALQDIKNAVDRLTTLPEDAERPIVSLASSRRQVISLVVSGDHDEHVLRQVADLARDMLLQDPDITLVERVGARPLEISIEAPQARLREHNLTLARIADELARATVEVAGGGVKTPAGEVLLRTMERRDYGAQYADLPLVSTASGTTVRVRDVAEIRDGFAETDQWMVYNGRPAIELIVYRVGQENPLDISAAVHAAVERLRGQLPEGVFVDTWSDRSELYRDRLHLLLKNAALGLALVMILLGFFLEVRLAFWVMMGIPTSFLGALLLLPAFDVSINMISLFAFIIAVGIVVDDAIVVGESIYYMRQKGLPFMRAAARGARMIAMPVVFSVLTNIVSFVPLLFVPGTMGLIWRNIPIIIISVFSISLVEALFILPAHLGKQKPEVRGWLWRIIEYPQEHLGPWLEGWVQRRYEPFLRMTTRHRYITVAIGLAVLILTVGWIRSGRMGFTFMPRVESDIVRASAVLPVGTPIEESRALLDRLLAAGDEIVAENGGPEIVRGVMAQIGYGDQGFGPFGAARFTDLWRQRVGAVPGVQSLTFRFTIGPSSSRPIDVQLVHPDPAIAERAARRVADALAGFAGVVEIDDGISRGKMQLDFKLKPAARSLGLTAAELARQVRAAFYGVEVRRQQRGRDEVKVFVRFPESERRSEYNVETLVLRTPAGGEIPLGEAADVLRGRSYETIQRSDGYRVLDVTADIQERVADTQKVLAGLKAGVLADLQRDYPLLQYSLEGEQRDMRESMSGLWTGFGVAFFVLFAMLAIPFKSYIQALIILVAIPFGIVGAIVGHILMGYTLSLVSVMGIVALSGVVINDSLILIDTANEYRRQGHPVREAIHLAPIRRFRPVILTSLTTFLGLAPMIFERSLQARFMIPMALSLGFGILFSTAITLALVPALYLIIEDLKHLFGRSDDAPAE